MTAPTPTEERALDALHALTPAERRAIALDLERLIELDGEPDYLMVTA